MSESKYGEQLPVKIFDLCTCSQMLHGMAQAVDMLGALPLHGTTDKELRVDISQSGLVISLGW